MFGLVALAQVSPDITLLTKYRWTYSVEMTLVVDSRKSQGAFNIEFSFEPSVDPELPIEIKARRIYFPGEKKARYATLFFEPDSWLSYLLNEPRQLASTTNAKPLGSDPGFIVSTRSFRQVAEILKRSSTKFQNGMVREWMSARISFGDEQIITVDRMIASDGMPIFADISLTSFQGTMPLFRLTRLSRKAKT